ncbi:MAG: trypsin-like serine protease [Candidatus Aminicenantes bacterium]|nr:trypsin-like serine protease [Candidatus Aminicenantes bacterium]NIQ66043.1 trypsin-like serine protease [Candidatus Aminicenantes bacterium]NIT22036.1 trypsin-like serine protease [Candidatus Aminicenantes bacterium]
MRTIKMIPLIIVGGYIVLMTFHLPGYGQSNTPTYEELIRTNVSLEMIGFGFYSGLRLNQQGRANGIGTEIKQIKWSGSGFIVKNDGTIFTNYHVARRALGGRAYFEDGSSFEIKTIIYYNEVWDIAVLKLRAFNRTFPTVKLGDSDKAQVMDRVLSVGNTLGERLAVTDGMINQIKTNDSGLRYQIRHSAAIAPGNSGGALYKGDKVIGINVAIRFPYAIYYAIPINLARLGLNYNREVLFRNAFPTTVSSMLKKSRLNFSINNTVRGKTNKSPGSKGYRTWLYPLGDYIIYLKAQKGRDLAVSVKDSRGKLIGYGDLRNVDYEFILLSSDYLQKVSIDIYNFDKKPANFAIQKYRIEW